MKKFLIAFCIGFSCSLFAAPYVTNVVAKQRYPWGIVDISCDVKGIEESREIRFSIEAVLPDSGEVKKASAVRFRGSGNTNTDELIAATDGNYRFVWNANVDLGSAHYTNIVVCIGIYKNPKKVQLWEDGPYWADMNIGANEPWESGYYFWWGDTIGYKHKNDKWVTSDGSNSDFQFNFSNTPNYGSGISTLKNEGWITAEAALALEHDAAKKHWGGNWRMPTRQEFDDLINKCDWSWTTMNDVAGYVVRGRGDYAPNSIFLPCAGSGSARRFRNAASHGYYWSSVPYSDYSGNAWCLSFSSDRHSSNDDCRYYGNSVRPLQGFSK
jgi:hypothetical protein